MIRHAAVLAAALAVCLIWAAGAARLPAADAKEDPGGLFAKGALPALEAPISAPQVAYNPGNRRDPFLCPLPYRKKADKLDDEELDRGAAPPGIAGTYIAKATLLGISMGEDGRLAVVRGADSRAYFLREGDRLFDGYVRAIDKDFITLVRETKMKSGKILTQDVTKRLRTP
jgi:hypothetical protein